MPAPVIAVTGATGFVGGRIVQALLADGCTVRALARRRPDRSGDNADHPALSWVAGSLEDETALAALVDGTDALVHCAGAIKARSRGEFFDVNAVATRRLAGIAAARPKPPRLVHISSLAAREPGLSAYAASKRAGEQMVRAFQDALRPVVLRPPAVYGPGDRETLRVFKLARRGFFPVPLSSAARTSMVHVDDVAAAVLVALKHPPASSAPIEFDDGHAGGYSWREIAAAAGAAVGTRPRVLPVPAPALYAVGIFGTLAARLSGRPGMLSWGKMAELLHPDWVAAGPSLAGYTPRWDMAKGFKNAANWYVSRGLLESNG